MRCRIALYVATALALASCLAGPDSSLMIWAMRIRAFLAVAISHVVVRGAESRRAMTAATTVVICSAFACFPEGFARERRPMAERRSETAADFARRAMSCASVERRSASLVPSFSEVLFISALMVARDFISPFAFSSLVASCRCTARYCERS